MKKTRLFASLFLVLALLSACSQAMEAVLTVGSQVYIQADLEALGTMSVDYTNKDGETTTYEGVPIADVLQDAGVADSGDTVTFTAADDYSADMALEEALACPNCIVAFDEGSLRLVMPDFSGKLQVKDLVTISVE